MTPTGTTRSKKPKANETAEKPVSQGRHEYRCSICSHPQQAEIERLFVNWESTAAIAKAFRIGRNAIYRHAHARGGLLEKRRQNVRAALERIIEHAGEVEVNAAAVVSAVSAYARINGRGEWVEKIESVNLNALFERMSAQELETYAQDGTLPAWFDSVLTGTRLDSRGGADGK